MRALVVGDGAPARDVVALGALAEGSTFEHCRNPDLAIERLRHAEFAFNWLMLSQDIEPPLRRCLGRAARRLDERCVISVFGGEDVRDTTEEDAALAEWRNVLSFAARAPEAYPALRDAYSARPAILQFHAPCKRIA